MAIMKSVELKGLLLTCTVAAVLGALVAAIVYFSPLKETTLAPLVNLVLIIAVFVGGSYVAKTRGSRGLIGGITLGIMFFVVMFVLTLIFSPNLPGFKSFLQHLCICLIAGGLGGIFGIGLSS
ncbi:MAG: TIGR04086 family membrane protein [Syntrophothermus sp.]|nr:TIGR04086 family membrane protein [Syntrophothermus sp.]